MAIDSVTTQVKRRFLSGRRLTGYTSIGLLFGAVIVVLAWIDFAPTRQISPLDLERFRFFERVRQHGGEIVYSYDPDWRWRAESWLKGKTSFPIPASQSSPHQKGSAHIPYLKLQDLTVTDDDLRLLQSLDRLRQLDLVDAHVHVSEQEPVETLLLESLEYLAVNRGTLKGPFFSYIRDSINLSSVALVSVDATEEALIDIGTLLGVQGVYFDFTPVSDHVLKAWVDQGNLSSLQSIHFYDAPISDAGLASLVGFRDLEYLSLARTKISDTGLEYVVGCRELTWLSLSDTAVTDAGLQHLVQLKKLRQLDLTGTNVTKEAVRKFGLANPNLKIKR